MRALSGKVVVVFRTAGTLQRFRRIDGDTGLGYIIIVSTRLALQHLFVVGNPAFVLGHLALQKGNIVHCAFDTSQQLFCGNTLFD